MKYALLILCVTVGCGGSGFVGGDDDDDDDDGKPLVIDEGTPIEVAPEFPPIQVYGAPVADPAISSTFGPRWKASDGRYDFHLGIDYYGELGTPVHAIGDGKVSATYPEGTGPFPNGGNVVVVEHELPRGRMFHGQPVTRFFAVYLHLDSIGVTADQVVTRGQEVGRMGMSGDTDFVHLHFETRIETVCSLPYQLANPELACVTGFDPHVHPFLFVGGDNKDVIRVEEIPAMTGLAVRVIATRGDLDLDVIEWDGGLLGFDERAGIDATSVAALDNFDYGTVRLSPLEFLSSSTEITYEIRFAERPQFLEVRDIFGRGLRFDSH